MATPTSPSQFDPLVEFEGKWTTELAERYLPIEGMPPAKYECWDGNLIVCPYESGANSYATMMLGHILMDPMRKAGYCLYGSLNIVVGDGRWVVPDITGVRQSVDDSVWVQHELVVMWIELVSPSSVRRDKVEKPAMCAELGVPYYMWVDVRNHNVHVELLRLNDGGSYVIQAKADLGQQFRTDLPFPFSFDTAVLLNI